MKEESNLMIRAKDLEIECLQCELALINEDDNCDADPNEECMFNILSN